MGDQLWPEWVYGRARHPEDEWTWLEPLTDAEDAELVAAVDREDSAEAYTCYDCPARRTCALAWETYNTDGDCLAEK